MFTRITWARINEFDVIWKVTDDKSGTIETFEIKPHSNCPKSSNACGPKELFKTSHNAK